ncbi:Uncharacterized protein BM_BM17750 [Brugia malayi]|uniref:Uncharacterized protein n=1 Tax=Brugia malayi TaxID=6279 RepID=A0A4E9FNH7_BRUMA|nr:Uncharacterized protein BM_BM17750 [Brugia malayi]VIO98076.1 Uncharacterized protein BM_BM17750 [Brugia malayi]
MHLCNFKQSSTTSIHIQIRKVLKVVAAWRSGSVLGP